MITLNTYVTRYLVIGSCIFFLLPRVNAKSSYAIEASVNDETFIVNGEVFKARTYCFDVRKGDKVIFTEGSAIGACSSAEFLNLRSNKKCEVWCE